MKTTQLKSTLFATLLLAGLTLTSCKKTESTETTETSADTTAPEGMSAKPMADTIVKDNDTIVKTGTENDTKDNPVGEQVP